jgi:hypothetical protein
VADRVTVAVERLHIQHHHKEASLSLPDSPTEPAATTSATEGEPSSQEKDEASESNVLLPTVAVIADVSAVVGIYATRNIDGWPAILAMIAGGTQVLLALNYLTKKRTVALSRTRRHFTISFIAVGAVALVAGAYLHLGTSSTSTSVLERSSAPATPPQPTGPVAPTSPATSATVTSPGGTSSGQGSPNGTSTRRSATTSTSSTPNAPVTQNGTNPAEAVFWDPSPTAPPLINAGDNVHVSGKVTGLSYGQLWIITDPQADTRYWIIQNKPTLTSDGTFDFTDQQVGNQDDEGKIIEYLALEADTACAEELRRANSTIDNIPPGCKTIGKSLVRVRKP